MKGVIEKQERELRRARRSIRCLRATLTMERDRVSSLAEQHRSTARAMLRYRRLWMRVSQTVREIVPPAVWKAWLDDQEEHP